MASNRVHYLRRKSYNTRSNKIRKLRFPGGRLGLQYVSKRSKIPQPGQATKATLTGLNACRGSLLRRSRIARAYGGVLTPCQVKDRILRAFLIEEVKVVKKFVKENKGAVQAKKAGKEGAKEGAKKPALAQKGQAGKAQAGAKKAEGKK